MEIVFGASIIAAFLAGVVALFAPCCITVLLPAYLASAFREKKDMLKMTFIFFLGLATVLVPIGLGAAGLARFFQDFHKQLWVFGGLFMLVLAFMSIRGKGISLPFSGKLKDKLKVDSKNHSKSVYFLGILSGAATSCCAPVLAGAMTLAVLSGGFWKAIIVTFAYVFGMIFPLFLTAYFYDKYKFDQSKFVKGKNIELSMFGKKVMTHSTNLLSGVMFTLIGGTMFVLGITSNTYWSPEHQAELGKSLTTWSIKVFSFLEIAPDFIWGVLILGIFGYFVYRVFNRKIN
jgi:cytochrome c biogenesis protein CcdA